MLKFKFGMVQIVLFALLGSVLKFVNGQAFSASSQSGPSHSPLQGFGNQYGSANWISTDSFSVNNGQCQNLNPLFLNDQQRGEWIQVAFNGPILVQCFEVFCGQFVNGIPQSYYSGCPQKIYMYGSNDGVNYTLLATYTPVTLSSSGSAASRGWELFPFLNSGMVSYQTYALKIAQIEIGAGSVGQQSAIITSLRYQVGTYAIAKVSASTSWPDLSFGPGYAFDGRPDTIWGSQSGNYNLSGDYIGTNSVEGYLGESLTVEFTAPIVVTSFNIWTRQCCLPNNPTDFSLYGFAAGTKKKYLLQHYTGVTGWTAGGYQTFDVAGASAYSSYVLVFNMIVGGSADVNYNDVAIAELQFNQPSPSALTGDTPTCAYTNLLSSVC